MGQQLAPVRRLDAARADDGMDAAADDAGVGGAQPFDPVDMVADQCDGQISMRLDSHARKKFKANAADAVSSPGCHKPPARSVLRSGAGPEPQFRLHRVLPGGNGAGCRYAPPLASPRETRRC